MKHYSCLLIAFTTCALVTGCAKKTFSIKTSPSTPSLFQSTAAYSDIAGSDATAEPTWTRFKLVVTNNGTDTGCVGTVRVKFSDVNNTVCEFVATEFSLTAFMTVPAGETVTSTQSFYCTGIGDEEDPVTAINGTIEAIGWVGSDCTAEDADKAASGEAGFSAVE
ncbi:MAG: hypothetical protein AB7F66_02970 [Bacteriovoracia bacterium]